MAGLRAPPEGKYAALGGIADQWDQLANSPRPEVNARYQVPTYAPPPDAPQFAQRTEVDKFEGQAVSPFERGLRTAWTSGLGDSASIGAGVARVIPKMYDPNASLQSTVNALGLPTLAGMLDSYAAEKKLETLKYTGPESENDIGTALKEGNLGGYAAQNIGAMTAGLGQMAVGGVGLRAVSRLKHAGITGAMLGGSVPSAGKTFNEARELNPNITDERALMAGAASGVGAAVMGAAPELAMAKWAISPAVGAAARQQGGFLKRTGQALGVGTAINAASGAGQSVLDQTAAQTAAGRPVNIDANRVLNETVGGAIGGAPYVAAGGMARGAVESASNLLQRGAEAVPEGVKDYITKKGESAWALAKRHGVPPGLAFESFAKDLMNDVPVAGAAVRAIHTYQASKALMAAAADPNEPVAPNLKRAQEHDAENPLISDRTAPLETQRAAVSRMADEASRPQVAPPKPTDDAKLRTQNDDMFVSLEALHSIDGDADQLKALGEAKKYHDAGQLEEANEILRRAVYGEDQQASLDTNPHIAEGYFMRRKEQLTPIAKILHDEGFAGTRESHSQARRIMALATKVLDIRTKYYTNPDVDPKTGEITTPKKGIVSQFVIEAAKTLGADSPNDPLVQKLQTALNGQLLKMADMNHKELKKLKTNKTFAENMERDSIKDHWVRGQSLSKRREIVETWIKAYSDGRVDELGRAIGSVVGEEKMPQYLMAISHMAREKLGTVVRGDMQEGDVPGTYQPAEQSLGIKSSQNPGEILPGEGDEAKLAAAMGQDESGVRIDPTEADPHSLSTVSPESDWQMLGELPVPSRYYGEQRAESAAVETNVRGGEEGKPSSSAHSDIMQQQHVSPRAYTSEYEPEGGLERLNEWADKLSVKNQAKADKLLTRLAADGIDANAADQIIHNAATFYAGMGTDAARKQYGGFSKFLEERHPDMPDGVRKDLSDLAYMQRAVRSYDELKGEKPKDYGREFFDRHAHKVEVARNMSVEGSGSRLNDPNFHNDRYSTVSNETLTRDDAMQRGLIETKSLLTPKAQAALEAAGGKVPRDYLDLNKLFDAGKPGNDPLPDMSVDQQRAALANVFDFLSHSPALKKVREAPGSQLQQLLDAVRAYEHPHLAQDEVRETLHNTLIANSEGKYVSLLDILNTQRPVVKMTPRDMGLFKAAGKEGIPIQIGSRTVKIDPQKLVQHVLHQFGHDADDPNATYLDGTTETKIVNKWTALGALYHGLNAIRGFKFGTPALDHPDLVGLKYWGDEALDNAKLNMLDGERPNPKDDDSTTAQNTGARVIRDPMILEPHSLVAREMSLHGLVALVNKELAQFTYEGIRPKLEKTNEAANKAASEGKSGSIYEVLARKREELLKGMENAPKESEVKKQFMSYIRAAENRFTEAADSRGRFGDNSHRIVLNADLTAPIDSEYAQLIALREYAYRQLTDVQFGRDRPYVTDATNADKYGKTKSDLEAVRGPRTVDEYGNTIKYTDRANVEIAKREYGEAVASMEAALHAMNDHEAIKAIKQIKTLEDLSHANRIAKDRQAGRSVTDALKDHTKTLVNEDTGVNISKDVQKARDSGWTALVKSVKDSGEPRVIKDAAMSDDATGFTTVLNIEGQEPLPISSTTKYDMMEGKNQVFGTLTITPDGAITFRESPQRRADKAVPLTRQQVMQQLRSAERTIQVHPLFKQELEGPPEEARTKPLSDLGAKEQQQALKKQREAEEVSAANRERPELPSAKAPGETLEQRRAKEAAEAAKTEGQQDRRLLRQAAFDEKLVPEMTFKDRRGKIQTEARDFFDKQSGLWKEMYLQKIDELGGNRFAADNHQEAIKYANTHAAPERQASLDIGVHPTTPEERASVEKLVKDLLNNIAPKEIDWTGKKVDLNKAAIVEEITKGSGDWAMRFGSALRDPHSTAYHESLHLLMNHLQQRADKGDKAAAKVIDTLDRALSMDYVQQQIKDAFKDHPNSKAIMDEIATNPHELRAYAFQLWAGGQLKLGPTATGFFQRLAAKLRQWMRMTDKAMNAESFFKAFKSGDLAKREFKPNALTEALGQTRVDTFVERSTQLMGPIADMARYAFGHLDTQILHLAKKHDIPELKEIASLYTDVGDGYHYVVQRESRRLASEYSLLREKLVTEHGAEASRTKMADALVEVRSGNVTSPEGKALQKVLHSVNKYADRKDKNGKPESIDFVPFIPDYRKISLDRDKFEADIADYGYEVGKANTASEIAAMLMNDYGSELRSEGVWQGKFKPEHVDVAEKWVQKDPDSWMRQFIMQTVKPTEHARIFGKKEEGSIAKHPPTIMKLREKAMLSGKLKPEHVRELDKFIDAAEGRLGRNLSPKIREFMKDATTAMNVLMLPLSLFSALIEPFQIASRANTPGALPQAYGKGFASIGKTIGTLFNNEHKLTPMEEFAERIGAIEYTVLVDALGDVWNGEQNFGRGKKLNDWFFKWNMLDGWSRAMRVAATEAGIDFIGDHYQKADWGNEKDMSARFMKQLKLEKGDIIIDAEGKPHLSRAAEASMTPEQERKLHRAINMFVDESAIRPNPATGAQWMSDPRFMWISHMKRFTWAFEKLILQRAYSEAAQGNLMPYGMLLASVPMAASSAIMREAVKPGAAQWMEKMSTMEWLNFAQSKAGMSGVWQYPTDVLTDPSYGLQVALGPELGQVVSTAQKYKSGGVGAALWNNVPGHQLFGQGAAAAAP